MKGDACNGTDFGFNSGAKDIGEQIQRSTGGLIGVVDFVGFQQIQNEPIERINDGLERLRAGQVTGRIVHAHYA